MSEIQILGQLKTNIITFIDELIDQYRCQEPEGDLIFLRIYYNNQIQPKDVMSKMIYMLNCNDQILREKIKERNTDYLFDSITLPPHLDSELFRSRIIMYKRMWRSLDEENRQIIWQWIDFFVSLSDRYVKIKNNTP